MFYLGTITGASGAASNQMTGPSGLGTFPIPQGTKEIFLMASASGLFFEMMMATAGSGFTGLTNAARSAQLDGPNLIVGPFRTRGILGQHTVISIFNPAGGFVSCRIYAGGGA